MTTKTVLIVDDRTSTLKVIRAILEDEGYTVFQATSSEDALQIYHQNDGIEVVLSDMKLPGKDGLALYRLMGSNPNPPPFVIMTAHGTVKSAVQALKEGVTHYLIKPLDYEELIILLDKAVREYARTRELIALKAQVNAENTFHGIIGADSRMKHIFDMVRTVGATDASVLIYGETGTGKELLAKALHQESPPSEQCHGLHQLSGPDGKPSGSRNVWLCQRGVYRCGIRSQGTG